MRIMYKEDPFNLLTTCNDNMNDNLKGKIVLITGCSGGIGRASARALAKLGCTIAVHHSSSSSKQTADTLVDEVTELGVRAKAFEADLSTYAATDNLYNQVISELGHPDILFSNHGATGKVIGPNGNIEDISVEMFEDIWRVNAGTHFRLAQLCAPHMEKQGWGRLIFTSSVAAKLTKWDTTGTGGVIGPHYASSKSALHGLVHWLSLRYCKHGVTANAISPALIEGMAVYTEMLSFMLMGIPDTAMMANPSPEARSKIPVGRLGKPDEIASIVVLCATNGYMTNKVIAADGGWTSGAM
ncbi:hypothetical protein QCA50_017337 [Cerrena zonata]|uniref:3-oxoacyl-[acyl-carrier-protein] reductase n=1 Tax=Cerrena zonata TaxID=2478898 RepID=A0AAW0FKT8_9APHY